MPTDTGVPACALTRTKTYFGEVRSATSKPASPYAEIIPAAGSPQTVPKSCSWKGRKQRPPPSVQESTTHTRSTQWETPPDSVSPTSLTSPAGQSPCGTTQTAPESEEPTTRPSALPRLPTDCDSHPPTTCHPRQTQPTADEQLSALKSAAILKPAGPPLEIAIPTGQKMYAAAPHATPRSVYGLCNKKVPGFYGRDLPHWIKNDERKRRHAITAAPSRATANSD